MKRSLRDEALRLGGLLHEEYVGGVFVIRVDAPRGQHWTDGAVHELKAEGRPTSAADRDDMRREVFARMRHGLETCDPDNQDCADNAEGE